MIWHCAFFKFRVGFSQDAARAFMEEFMALKNKIDGVIDMALPSCWLRDA